MTNKTMNQSNERVPIVYTKELKDIGKLPPQAPDFERAILGALLLEGDALNTVITILSQESFYEPKNQIIYGSILTLHKQNEPIDLLTVVQQLKKEGTLDEVGGVLYISELTETVGSASHIEYHALIVQQKAISRQVITATTKINNMAYMEGIDVDDLIQFADKTITEIMEKAYSSGTMKHVKSVLDEVETDFKKRIKRREEGLATGVTTGLVDLDNRLGGGWQNQTLNIIASRPGMGKTALMLHLAKAAARSGTPVCIYSMEMSDVSLTNRLVIGEAYKSKEQQIRYDRFRLGQCNDEEWKLFEEAKERLEQLPIYIDDNPVVTPMYIRTHSNLMKKRGQCGLVLIDYLQLTDMSTENSRYRNREQEVSQTTRQFKISSKQCDVPFVLLSQLNRAVESRDSKKPQLADLRESGAIEQDADTVSFIYRPAYYKIDDLGDGKSTENMGFIIIAKQREGESNVDVPFSHNDSLTRIFDYSGDLDPFSGLVQNEKTFYYDDDNTINNIENPEDLPF